MNRFSRCLSLARGRHKMTRRPRSACLLWLDASPVSARVYCLKLRHLDLQLHLDQRNGRRVIAASPNVRIIAETIRLSRLTHCSGKAPDSLTRHASSYAPLNSFTLPRGDTRHYQQQYAQVYFARLAVLKPTLERIADEEWGDFELGNTQVQHVHRVLDVRQGHLCWIVGTIYLDMPLKPNVLDDIAAEQAIAVPPPREKYVNDDDEEQVFLEDESGRLRMVGAPLRTNMLVTGCIVAVMGTETANGDFEIIDLRIPDLAPQSPRWAQEEATAVKVNGTSKRKKEANSDRPSGGKIALVSGLGITGDVADVLKIDMLTEYLTGEMGVEGDESDTSKISRLIIAGNSVVTGSVQDAKDILGGKKAKKTYGYDASAYNPAPTLHLDRFLAQLLPTIPVTLLPGESDPANVALPQQPIHPAMLPHARTYGTPMNTEESGWFDSVSNPWEGDIDGWRFLGTGGQPVDDVFRYVHSNDRLDMMECLLRWRNSAPTAPDTLCKFFFICPCLKTANASQGPIHSREKIRSSSASARMCTFSAISPSTTAPP